MPLFFISAFSLCVPLFIKIFFPLFDFLAFLLIWCCCLELVLSLCQPALFLFFLPPLPSLSPSFFLTHSSFPPRLQQPILRHRQKDLSVFTTRSRWCNLLTATLNYSCTLCGCRSLLACQTASSEQPPGKSTLYFWTPIKEGLSIASSWHGPNLISLCKSVDLRRSHEVKI